MGRALPPPPGLSLASTALLLFLFTFGLTSVSLAQPPSSLLSVKRGLIVDDESGFTSVDSLNLPGSPSLDVVGIIAINVTDADYNAQDQHTALYWALYTDDDESWPVVLAQRSNWTCERLLSVSPNFPAKAAMRFGSWDRAANSSSISIPVRSKYRHWWFPVLARVSDSTSTTCDSIRHVEYSITFTQSTAPVSSS